MAHPQGWEVGMEVCVVYTLNVRGDPTPRTETITKVGRKWITTACIRGLTTRFDAETLYIDGGSYASPGKVYADEEEYRRTTLKQELWKDFHIRLTSHAPDHLTVDDVKSIRSLVFPGLWDE
jgi:hypothetical protein